MSDSKMEHYALAGDLSQDDYNRWVAQGATATDCGPNRRYEQAAHDTAE